MVMNQSCQSVIVHPAVNIQLPYSGWLGLASCQCLTESSTRHKIAGYCLFTHDPAWVHLLYLAGRLLQPYRALLPVLSARLRSRDIFRRVSEQKSNSRSLWLMTLLNWNRILQSVRQAQICGLAATPLNWNHVVSGPSQYFQAVP